VFLTDTAIRTAKPNKKPVNLSDGKDLYLLVTPTGGKWWWLDYRFAGKRKALSIGVYLDVSLKDARGHPDHPAICAAPCHRLKAPTSPP